MLVLSRKRDEAIMIGDLIQIVVVEIRGDKVRLGIKGPREIPVHRMEVYHAIQRQKEIENAKGKPANPDTPNDGQGTGGRPTTSVVGNR